MNQTRRDFLLTAAGLTLAAETKLHAGITRSELAKYDAIGLAELVKTKQISALELVDDVARRMERVNSKLNAVLTKNFDFEKARDRAKNGVGDGRFAGAPVMLKNLTEYKDARIDQGSRLFARVIAKNGILDKASSPLVDAMERSGMIVTGITNAPEFGLIDTTEPILHGPTRNPWNTGRTAGGSSGGTAAAIAAGIVPLAHGNDGGGSIRIPSCQCGVFGLKPTRGRELGNGHRAGNEVLNISSDLCLSRSVRDSAAFLDIVEHKDDPSLKPVGFVAGPSKKRLKIAFVREAFSGKLPDPAVEKAASAAAKLCSQLGHHVEESKLPINGNDFIDAFIGFWASSTVPLEAQVAKLLGKDVKPEDVLEPWTLGLIEMAKTRGPDVSVQRAIKVFTEVSAQLEKMFQSYDVILSPVMREPPYPIGWHDPSGDFKTILARTLDVVGYTPLHNAAGTPAMSVPLEWTADGLPIGIQFAAWRGGEATLLQLAYELEAAHPWAGKHPPIFAS